MCQPSGCTLRNTFWLKGAGRHFIPSPCDQFSLRLSFPGETAELMSLRSVFRTRTQDNSCYEATQDCHCWQSISGSVAALLFGMKAQVSDSRSLTYHHAGKSSLTVQYCEGHFVESYYPTIENTFSHEIQYKGQKYATEIIDTAGQVR
jgi:Ras family